MRAVVVQLADGLAFLHARGVIHRDVKPSNALVGADGVVKLLDFGLALRGAGAHEQHVVGTAAYLAPEYVERLAISPAMDLYALGVVAFELATGAPPFGGTLHVVARLARALPLPRVRTLNPACPADLDDTIAALLAADPARRPAARDVAARLSGALSRPPVAHGAARFVGRAAELAAIRARLADPVRRGQLVLVGGPSGAGKTALVDEAIAGALAWRGRCDERERVPYRAFDAIVDDLASELAADPALAASIDHAGALARVFPALASALASDDDVAAEDLRVERERALVAIVQLFRQLLGDQLGIVAIDDLQWADDDSLDLVALLVERIDRPLAIVASWTIGDGALPAAARALVDRLGAAAAVVELRAMPEAELAAVIGELAPRVPATRVAAAARLAAGSPYLADLIGRELAADDVDDPADAERRRFARLGAAERAVAEIAALAAGSIGFEELRALAELPSEKLVSALRGLEDQRIVRTMPSPSGDPVYAFYHQRLRDAAHGGLSGDARRAIHRRFATWFERVGAAPDRLAYHWREAGDAARGARWAIAAAEAARTQLAWGLAADWYERALALGAPDPIAARAGRADALFLAGKLASAAHELERLASEVRDGDGWRVRAAEAYIKLGEIDRGLAILDGVLVHRGHPRALGRAGSALRAAGVAARWLVPIAPRREPADDVLAAAYRVIASFLSTPYPIEAFEYVLRGVALAERRGDLAAHGMGLAMVGAYLAAGTLGRFGDRAIARADGLATASGARYPRMVVAGCRGILAMLRGDWLAMRRTHEDGERVCRELGLERSWEASFLRSYWALGELYAGEPRRALALLEGLADASDDLFVRALIGSYRGRALVALGELDAAGELARRLDDAPAARFGLASIYRQVLGGELALAHHDWPRAAAIAGELARTARAQWLTTMPAVSAMIDLLAATAELGRAVGGDRVAAGRVRKIARRLYRRGGASFYASTALRLGAQAAALLGDRAGATAALAAAADASARGGKIDRLAVAALRGEAIGDDPLAAAVGWATGGAVRA